MRRRFSAEPGETYVAKVGFFTYAGKEYAPGDEFFLIERTRFAPFGFISFTGTNWIVRCKHFSPPAKECVWSSIDGMILFGMLTQK